jgi:hypothetical protein
MTLDEAVKVLAERYPNVVCQISARINNRTQDAYLNFGAAYAWADRCVTDYGNTMEEALENLDKKVKALPSPEAQKANKIARLEAELAALKAQ